MKGIYVDVLRQYKKFVPPILIGTLISFGGIVLSDTIMITRLGHQYLAATSLANSLFIIFFIFSIGISAAVAPVISKSFAQNGIIEATKILKNTLVLNMIIGIILYLCMIAIYYNLHIFKQSKSIIDISRSYMCIIAVSILPNCCRDILKKYIEGTGKPYVTMTGSIMAFFVNMIFNYILIYGKFGFPALGIHGAAWATLIARSADTLLMAFYTFIILKREKIIEQFIKIRISLKEIIKLAKICMPSAIQLSLEFVYFAILNVMIGWVGIIPQASHAVLNSLYRVSLIIPLSISIATSIIVGKYLGKQDIQSIKTASILSYFSVILSWFIISVLLYIFVGKILYVYNTNTLITKNVISTIFIFILFFLVDGLNILGSSLLRGLQDNTTSATITSSIQFILGIPLAYFFVFILKENLYGLWMASAVTFSISAAILIVRFKYKIRSLSFHKDMYT